MSGILREKRERERKGEEYLSLFLAAGYCSWLMREKERKKRKRKEAKLKFGRQH